MSSHIAEQDWFEMTNIRKRWLNKAVWIPLRAINTIEEIGNYGTLGYKQEFYGLGSLAVLIENKEKAEKLKWMDIGISHEHGAYVDSGKYIPSDIYEHYSDGTMGVALALEQRINREELPVWHLHQDFVIALGLKRETDTWVCPNESYTEVARLLRYQDGRPYLLEVRAEYLRDYLCARSMSLYITSYRNREEVVEDKSHISWEENPKCVLSNGDRWEGRVSDIHEGGTPFGAKTAVFHAARTDVDPDEDVPTFDFPTDDEVTSKSWTKTDEGRKLYRIQGELWRNEWVEPSEFSPRIRNDDIPASVFFITDATGMRESKDSLVNGSRWLWFKPNVVMVLVHRRGGSLYWYTKDTGCVRCSPDYDINFGVNRLGLVNVYAKDIALLPEWQQRIWAGFNISPEGGVSEELLASQMRAMPAGTKAPESFLSESYSTLNKVVTEKMGAPLFRENVQHTDLLRLAHRFRAIDQAGLFALAKDLARLTADSIDTKLLQKIVSPPKGEKWGSLKSLEKVLASVISPEEARATLSTFVGIYELRHADAHLKESSVNEALILAGVDPNGLPIEQGYQLMHACVSTLYKIAAIISKLNGGGNHG